MGVCVYAVDGTAKWEQPFWGSPLKRHGFSCLPKGTDKKTATLGTAAKSGPTRDTQKAKRLALNRVSDGPCSLEESPSGERALFSVAC